MPRSRLKRGIVVASTKDGSKREARVRAVAPVKSILEGFPGVKGVTKGEMRERGVND